MRLDIDCIRDILLCVEENTGLRQHCFFVDSGLTSVEEFLAVAEGVTSAAISAYFSGQR